jgi:hypothetical protein
MLESLQFALKYPKIYHDIGTERLKEEGPIKVLEYSNRYRIKPAAETEHLLGLEVVAYVGRCLARAIIRLCGATRCADFTV